MTATVNVVEPVVEPVRDDDFLRRLRAFQDRLERRRVQRGLKMKELERRSGIPYSTLRRILVGNIKELPKRNQLEGLAKGLNYQPEVLNQEAIEVIDPSFNLYADHSEEMKLWIITGEKLSDTQRRAIRRMAEELLRDDDS